MKQFLILGALLVAGYVSFNAFGEWKAESKIELARSMAEEGRYEEAIETYDDVEEWFGWTEASQQVVDLRAEVVEKIRRRDAELARQQMEEQEDKQLDYYEQQQEDFEERREDSRRRAQEAREKVRQLTGGG